LVSGSVTLNANQSVDLDILQLDAGGSDVVYRQTDDVHQLSPLAGASLGLFGAGQPTYGQCRDTAAGADTINLREMAVGSHFCYITNQGLTGWGRLDALDTENNTVTITVLTWATLE
jgi:hypothetical protein